MTEIMLAPLCSLSALSLKAYFSPLDPDLCLSPVQKSGKTSSLAVYIDLTSEEEMQAHALVSALEEVSDQLDQEMEAFCLRDHMKRLKVVSLGDPSRSRWLQRRGKGNFFNAAPAALSKVE